MKDIKCIFFDVGSAWLSNYEGQAEIVLRLYAPKSEMINLTFNPLKLSEEPDWIPQWEGWHAYAATC